MTLRLHARVEHWPLARPFAISRGAHQEAVSLVVEVTRDGVTGRGESTPYARYGETPAGALAATEKLARDGLPADREGVAERLPAGAARNALDCAYWDLEARERGVPVWRLAGLPEPGPVTTAYTIGLDSPAAMGKHAGEAAGRPLLKVKLGGGADDEALRIRAVRAAAPDARIIVDANEGWTPDLFRALGPALSEARVELVEQPLPADRDAALADLPRPAPLCADESCLTRRDLDRVRGLYDFVNVKLDKTGGLTEALALCRAARTNGFGLFLGCMLAGSLATAPALLLARLVDYVDLDGPLYMLRDRHGGVRIEGSTLHPPAPGFWG